MFKFLTNYKKENQILTARLQDWQNALEAMTGKWIAAVAEISSLSESKNYFSVQYKNTEEELQKTKAALNAAEHVIKNLEAQLAVYQERDTAAKQSVGVLVQSENEAPKRGRKKKATDGE